MDFSERWFEIEGVNMRWPPREKQVDDSLSLGRKVRLSVQVGSFYCCCSNRVARAEN